MEDRRRQLIPRRGDATNGTETVVNEAAPATKSENEQMFIKVTVGDSSPTIVPLTDSITIREALRRAGHAYNDSQSVSLNSKMVNDLNATVKPGDKVNVIERVANGERQ